MTRFPRSAKSRARNSVHEILAVTAIGATLALGVVATDQYVVAKRHAAAARAAAAAAGADEIYTGSILYMPDTSNICHQWLFDNHNGQFNDNGYVNCERAFYQGSPDSPKQWSAARVRVISSGFRGE
jgi:hypothetical protein